MKNFIQQRKQPKHNRAANLPPDNRNKNRGIIAKIERSTETTRQGVSILDTQKKKSLPKSLFRKKKGEDQLKKLS